MEEKKNTGMVVVIIILMLIITGLCSYIVYDKVYKQKNNEEKIENKDAGNVKNDTDDTALFDKLIKKYNIGNDNKEIRACFIDARFFDSVDSMKEVDVAYALLASFDTSTIKQEKSSLIKEDEKEGYSIISKATYEDLFKNYFGVDPKVKSKEVATLTEVKDCEGYILVKEDGNYYGSIGCGCGSEPRKDVITSKKRVDNNTIIIDKKYYTYEDIFNNQLYIGSKNIKTTCDISKEECFSNYSDYFDTIRYTFTKQSDGNYYIQSIKNLKDAKEYK